MDPSLYQFFWSLVSFVYIYSCEKDIVVFIITELEDTIHFNESASDTTFLYSIVGAGSSVAVILLVLLVAMIAIALAKFLWRCFRK